MPVLAWVIDTLLGVGGARYAWVHTWWEDPDQPTTTDKISP